MTHTNLTKKTLAAVAALGTSAALLLSGCSTPPPKAPASTSQQVQPPAQTQPAPPPPEQTQSDHVPFGGTSSTSDGIQFTVSQPVPVPPGNPNDYVGMDVKGMTKWYKVTLTIHNNGKAVWDPSMLLTSVLTGETQAQEILGYGGDIPPLPQTSLLPGHTLKVSYIYAGTPGEVVVQVDGMNVDNGPHIWHN